MKAVLVAIFLLGQMIVPTKLPAKPKRAKKNSGKVPSSATLTASKANRKAEETKNGMRNSYTFQETDYQTFQGQLGTNKVEVVLFTKKSPKRPSITLGRFQQIRNVLGQVKVPFLHVSIGEAEAGRSKIDHKRLPSLYLYVDSIGRHFNGEFKVPDVALWLKEAISADLFEIKDISQVLKMDKHYYAYAKTSWSTRNLPQLESLARLVYPVGLYTGLTPKQEAQAFKGRKKGATLWVYRKFDHQLITIDTTGEVESIVTQILEGEHLKSLTCDDHAYPLLRDVKLPVAVYFAAPDDPLDNWRVIEEVAKAYHEYLTPVLVEADNDSRCGVFLNSFLEVERKPSLRILNIHGKIRRHLFVGTFETKHVNFFFSNYIHGNLKTFKINEKLPEEALPTDRILPLNSKGLNSLLKGSNFENLVYIYEPGHPNHGTHITLLEELRLEAQKWSQRLRFFTFDAHKNDIGHKMLEKTPFLILVKSDGKTDRFHGRIDDQRLREFLSKGLKEISDAADIEGL
jgi:hypothetical protein